MKNKKSMKNNRKRGFTLVEAVISILLIVIIGSTAIMLSMYSNTVYNDSIQRFESRISANNMLAAYMFATNKYDFEDIMGIAGIVPDGESFSSEYFYFKSLRFTDSQRKIEFIDFNDTPIISLEYPTEAGNTEYSDEKDNIVSVSGKSRFKYYLSCYKTKTAENIDTNQFKIKFTDDGVERKISVYLPQYLPSADGGVGQFDYYGEWQYYSFYMDEVEKIIDPATNAVETDESGNAKKYTRYFFMYDDTFKRLSYNCYTDDPFNFGNFGFTDDSHEMSCNFDDSDALNDAFETLKSVVIPDIIVPAIKTSCGISNISFNNNYGDAFYEEYAYTLPESRVAYIILEEEDGEYYAKYSDESYRSGQSANEPIVSQKISSIGRFLREVKKYNMIPAYQEGVGDGDMNRYLIELGEYRHTSAVIQDTCYMYRDDSDNWHLLKFDEEDETIYYLNDDGSKQYFAGYDNDRVFIFTNNIAKFVNTKDEIASAWSNYYNDNKNLFNEYVDENNHGYSYQNAKSLAIGMKAAAVLLPYNKIYEVPVIEAVKSGTDVEETNHAIVLSYNGNSNTISCTAKWGTDTDPKSADLFCTNGATLTFRESSGTLSQSEYDAADALLSDWDTFLMLESERISRREATLTINYDSNGNNGEGDFKLTSDLYDKNGDPLFEVEANNRTSKRALNDVMTDVGIDDYLHAMDQTKETGIVYSPNANATFNYYYYSWQLQKTFDTIQMSFYQDGDNYYPIFFDSAAANDNNRIYYVDNAGEKHYYVKWNAGYMSWETNGYKSGYPKEDTSRRQHNSSWVTSEVQYDVLSVAEECKSAAEANNPFKAYFENNLLSGIKNDHNGSIDADWNNMTNSAGNYFSSAEALYKSKGTKTNNCNYMDSTVTTQTTISQVKINTESTGGCDPKDYWTITVEVTVSSEMTYTYTEQKASRSGRGTKSSPYKYSWTNSERSGTISKLYSQTFYLSCTDTPYMLYDYNYKSTPHNLSGAAWLTQSQINTKQNELIGNIDTTSEIQYEAGKYPNAAGATGHKLNTDVSFGWIGYNDRVGDLNGNKKSVTLGFNYSETTDKNAAINPSVIFFKDGSSYVCYNTTLDKWTKETSLPSNGISYDSFFSLLSGYNIGDHIKKDNDFGGMVYTTYDTTDYYKNALPGTFFAKYPCEGSLIASTAPTADTQKYKNDIMDDQIGLRLVLNTEMEEHPNRIPITLGESQITTTKGSYSIISVTIPEHFESAPGVINQKISEQQYYLKVDPSYSGGIVFVTNAEEATHLTLPVGSTGDPGTLNGAVELLNKAGETEALRSDGGAPSEEEIYKLSISGIAYRTTQREYKTAVECGIADYNNKSITYYSIFGNNRVPLFVESGYDSYAEFYSRQTDFYNADQIIASEIGGVDTITKYAYQLKRLLKKVITDDDEQKITFFDDNGTEIIEFAYRGELGEQYEYAKEYNIENCTFSGLAASGLTKGQTVLYNDSTFDLKLALYKKAKNVYDNNLKRFLTTWTFYNIVFDDANLQIYYTMGETTGVINKKTYYYFYNGSSFVKKAANPGASGTPAFNGADYYEARMQILEDYGYDVTIENDRIYIDAFNGSSNPMYYSGSGLDFTKGVKTYGSKSELDAALAALKANCTHDQSANYYTFVNPEASLMIDFPVNSDPLTEQISLSAQKTASDAYYTTIFTQLYRKTTDTPLTAEYCSHNDYQYIKNRYESTFSKSFNSYKATIGGYDVDITADFYGKGFSGSVVNGASGKTAYELRYFK